MMQTAIFVDAGYLIAQGATLIAGAKTARQRVTFHTEPAAALLVELARAAAPDARLLRIYWYDGLIRGGSQTAEHVALGRTANVKLRLGMVNSRGEQKGVDSLIVTDLIELARNRAISDAVVLSGDEDIRVGLQVAQTHGVRVQLVGVKPALGSQSPDLVAEADTHVELSEAQIAPLLSLVAPIEPGAARGGRAAADVAKLDRTAAAELGFVEEAPILASELIAAVDVSTAAALRAYVEANRGALPGEFDRPALAKLRDRLGRDIDNSERRQFRIMLRNALNAV